MDRINRYLLIARITQILLGMVLFGCSVAIVAHYNYWDGVDPARTISASFLGFGTVFLGVSGLIALDTRPDGLNGARLYMLVLLLDCAAFLSSIAGATCLVTVAGYRWNQVLFIIPIVCGYLNLFAILVPMIRYFRLKKAHLLGSTAHIDHGQEGQQLDAWYTPPLPAQEAQVYKSYPTSDKHASRTSYGSYGQPVDGVIKA